MNRLFGVKNKNKAPPPSLNDAITSVDGRADNIDQKIKKLDVELAKYRDQLKRTNNPHSKANLKQRAMRILKQKRMYEQSRDQLMNQSFSMEQTNFAMESTKDTLSTVAAMKHANKSMKKEMKKINIDDIEDIQDDIEDMLEQSNEIQETLGRAYGVPEDIDESELEAELEMLGDDVMLDDDTSFLDEATQEMGDIPTELPTAPPGAQQQQQETDEFGLPVASGAK